jgi:hypothetical protein
VRSNVGKVQRRVQEVVKEAGSYNRKRHSPAHPVSLCS